MDFENYTVGSLYADRGNYQMEHSGLVAGLAYIRGRVWQLGWRLTSFSEIDKRIGEDQWRRHEKPTRTERYGKKYGWISYYELAGRLEEHGELRKRMWIAPRSVWPDIDPTFPKRPAQVELALPAWASGGPDDERRWYCTAPIDVPTELLTPEALDGEPGPWLLVEGYLEHKDRERARRVFGFFRGVLVEDSEVDELARQLSKRPYLGNSFLPDAPHDHSTFAGEMPWSAGFAAHGDTEHGLAPYRAPVHENWDEPAIEIELLGHGYDVELERTTTNVATGHWVPSHSFAAAFDLRQRPSTLDLVSLDGRVASLTRAGPDGFDGKLLYLRADLVTAYAGSRRLIQLAWGERQIDFDWHHPPDWLKHVGSEHADLWRKVSVAVLDPNRVKV